MSLSLYKKVFVTALLLSNVLLLIAFAQKEAPPEDLSSLALRLYFDGETIVFDPSHPNPVSASVKEPAILTEGSFRIETHSPVGQILNVSYLQPRLGLNIVYLPYFLNAAEVTLINPTGKIDSKKLEGLIICNENRLCEINEENLCPLDCEAAVNQGYPLTPAALELQKIILPSQPPAIRPQPQPLETAPFTPETSQRQFQVSLMFLGGGLVLLLLIFGLVYWFNKKK